MSRKCDQMPVEWAIPRSIKASMFAVAMLAELLSSDGRNGTSLRFSSQSDAANHT
jgi:hypothetical protein